MRKNVLLLLALFAVGVFTSKVQAQKTMLDRAGWTVIPSTSSLATGAYDYVPDGATGLPTDIFDGEVSTFFSLVKPGKSYGGCSTPVEHTLFFIVDMQETQSFDLIRWQHRNNGGQEILRVWSLSIHGSTDGETFVLLKEDVDTKAAVPADITFETPVSYRYLQFTYNTWNTSSGSTLQVGELNVGISSDEEPEEPVTITPLNRTGWTAISSTTTIIDGTYPIAGNDTRCFPYTHVPDTAQGFNGVYTPTGHPEAMFDDDTRTFFSIIKPNKKYTSIVDKEVYATPADLDPYFIVDMKTTQQFDVIQWAHRTSGGAASLYVQQISAYGSNDGVTFNDVLIENATVNSTPEPISVAGSACRYLKIVYEKWNTGSGSSLQVGEFSLGKLSSTGIETVPAPATVSIYPNPATKGQPVTVETSAGSIIEVWDFLGRLALTTNETTINTSELNAGIYVVNVKGAEGSVYTGKLIVR